ncbi:MAG: hypothetical protein ACYSPJ_07265, partial [Planctomycetota bacterium]|jgi:hypothetical protein
LSIRDEGVFAFQHELLTPEIAADPNVVVDKGVTVNPKADKLVMVVHGWMDKGQDSEAIGDRTDPNEWVCGSYDWRGGSVVITSVQAAEYARDMAGPRLAKALLELGTDFKHIHLIGHSAGTWTIHSAAKRIAAARPDVQLHLTFLDAYVPSQWDADELGHVFNDPKQLKSLPSMISNTLTMSIFPPSTHSLASTSFPTAGIPPPSPAPSPAGTKRRKPFTPAQAASTTASTAPSNPANKTGKNPAN